MGGITPELKISHSLIYHIISDYSDSDIRERIENDE